MSSQDAVITLVSLFRIVISWMLGDQRKELVGTWKASSDRVSCQVSEPLSSVCIGILQRVEKQEDVFELGAHVALLLAFVWAPSGSFPTNCSYGLIWAQEPHL